MRLKMSGYDWTACKSNRAVEAEERGCIPLSKINKDVLEFWGLENFTVTFIKWYLETYRGVEEWHHTSPFFNKTDYYDMEGLKEELADNIVNIKKKYQESLAKKIKKPKCEKSPVSHYAVVDYKEFTKSSGWLKVTFKRFAGIVDATGRWVVSGSRRKNLQGKHITSTLKYYVDCKVPRKALTKIHLDKIYPTFEIIASDLLDAECFDKIFNREVSPPKFYICGERAVVCKKLKLSKRSLKYVECSEDMLKILQNDDMLLRGV